VSLIRFGRIEREYRAFFLSKLTVDRLAAYNVPHALATSLVVPYQFVLVFMLLDLRLILDIYGYDSSQPLPFVGAF